MSKCKLCKIPLSFNKKICSICAGGGFIYAEEYFMSDVENADEIVKIYDKETHDTGNQRTFGKVSELDPFLAS